MTDISVDVTTMRMSGDREEYFLQIKRDGRCFPVSSYRNPYRNRVEYDRDSLLHVLFGEAKPRLSDAQYRDPKTSISEAPPQTTGFLMGEIDRLQSELAALREARVKPLTPVASQEAIEIAERIERYGCEHDRFLEGWGLPDNCVAIFREGNITCFQPLGKALSPVTSKEGV